MNEPFVSEVFRANIEEDGRTIKGVASTVGNVDRMRRVFLPGAFGTKGVRVPLLAFHDDHRPIGSSMLIPQGGVLRHESTLARTQFADEIRELVRAGAIPATSIGWVSEDRYFGWSSLERADKELAREAAAMGLPQSEDITYFASAEIVENSVVPVPANPMALISAASLLRGKQRGMVEGLLEMAAGFRHSSADQAALQRAHDALVEAGASCSGSAATGWTAADSGSDENGYVMRKGKRVFDPDNDGDDDSSAETDTDHDYWDEDGKLTPKGLRTKMPRGDRSMVEPDEYAADKPRFSMPDGSYPIDTCSDVADAAKLANHSKTYTFEQVRRHVMKAKNALNCPDSVIPDSWSSGESSGLEDVEEGAVWSTSYVNDLPDSCFLYIEDGGEKDSEGKTTPRSKRHFPYKDDSGKVDLPHLRNALARIPQSNLPQSVKDSVMAKAKRIAQQNGVGSDESSLEPDFSEVERELAELQAQLSN